MRVQTTIGTARGIITIIQGAAPADVDGYEISLSLSSIVRSTTIRRRLLRDLAADPVARLTLAVAEGQIIGHLAIGPSFGRWRSLPRVREVAFEVAREWRHLGLVSKLLQASMADPLVEHEIILGFLWPAAWDLAEASESCVGYREFLTRLASRGGFRVLGTDEPELIFQQGAALVARVGARVPRHAAAAFERARYADGRQARAAS